MSGEITVTPGAQLSVGQRITRALLNLLATPTAQLNENSVGSRELIAAEVRTIVPNVNRNLLINGNFDVWQRGGYLNLIGLPIAMGTGNGPDMGADRWALITPSGSSKREITLQTFGIGQSDVPNEPTYYLRYKATAAETGDYRAALSQYIEDVRTLAGKQAVVTWWMKGNYSGNITCQLVQTFGVPPVGPSVYHDVTIAADSGGAAVLVSGAAWTKYTAKFTIPSLLGMGIDGPGHALVLDFILPDNTTFQIDFAQIQLEEGTEATSYETLPYLEELRQCERYFEYHGGTAWDDVTHGHPCFYFATRKYRAPTLTLLAGYTGTMDETNFDTILDTGYKQSTANSAVSDFFMACESEISMP